MAPQAQVVFTGLCSFINVDNAKDDTMPDPSVILVRTQPAAMPGMNDMETHVPFIAFDSTTMKVDDSTGFNPVTVPDLKKFGENLDPANIPTLQNALQFQFLPLDGVEIAIDGDESGAPNVASSYDDVAKKDKYWPQSAGKWNRDFVPVRGGKPNPTAVAAFMRFGSGTITANRVSNNEWQFRFPNGTESIKGKFAREVQYSDFPIQGNAISMSLKKLDTGEVIRKLQFSSVDGNGSPLMVWIGNNLPSDMAFAVQRVSLNVPGTGDHFVFLNRAVDPAVGPGPTPELVLPIPVPLPPLVTHDETGEMIENKVGMATAGYCGPNSQP